MTESGTPKPDESNRRGISRDRLARYSALVSDVDAKIANAAFERLTIDNTPWSFATLRSEIAAGEKE